MDPAFRADEIRRLKRDFDALPLRKQAKRKEVIAAKIDGHLSAIRRDYPDF